MQYISHNMVILALLSAEHQGAHKSRKNPAFLMLALLLCVSCSRNNTRAVLVPPSTDPLTGDYIGFGVVNVSFTHVRDNAAEDGISLGYLRKGSLVRIIERKISSQNDSSYWLYVYSDEAELNGWLNESIVDIYDNESRALTAAGALSP